VTFAGGASPDTRNYRVNCDKIRKVLPSYQPQWTVRKGVEEVYDAYCKHKTTNEEFLSSSFIRLKKIRELQEAGKLDNTLAWRARTAA